MNCTRCLSVVSPSLSNIEHFPLHHIGVDETLSKVRCDNCRECVCISVSREEWGKVDSVLRKGAGRGNGKGKGKGDGGGRGRGGSGWKVIEEKDDLVKLYVLCQVVCNEMEGKVAFDFPDKTDLVKILWKEGNAIGYYSLKLKESVVMETMEAYGMTTLDTAYIRKDYRGRGFGLSILEDIVCSFPDEDIGISTPISLSMHFVIRKFLQKNPKYKTKLWEISGVGSEGNRKLVFFSLKKLFNI